MLQLFRLKIVNNKKKIVNPCENNGHITNHNLTRNIIVVKIVTFYIIVKLGGTMSVYPFHLPFSLAAIYDLHFLKTPKHLPTTESEKIIKNTFFFNN